MKPSNASLTPWSLQHLPLLVTGGLFVAMAGAGGVLHDGFFTPQVFLNLLIDNAFLCIVAVGMTFVILSGGIDLSVGAVLACCWRFWSNITTGIPCPRWR